MSTLTLGRIGVHQGPLILVNAQHPYRPAEAPALAPVGRSPGGQPVLLEQQAAKMMGHLMAAAGGQGEILPVSGHRSHAEQQAIYDDTLQKRGEAFTRQYVALPGHSEHETGLALDVTAAKEAFDFICPSFPSDGLSGRFSQLAALYGFILRYPKGKSDITGIAYEPWHFRYVGWPHSSLMAARGWTLEEYIDTLAHCEGPENALVCQEQEYAIRSYTLPFGEGDALEVDLPTGVAWQASGNNIAGMVVTTWT